MNNTTKTFQILVLLIAVFIMVTPTDSYAVKITYLKDAKSPVKTGLRKMKTNLKKGKKNVKGIKIGKQSIRYNKKSFKLNIITKAVSSKRRNSSKACKSLISQAQKAVFGKKAGKSLTRYFPQWDVEEMSSLVRFAAVINTIDSESLKVIKTTKCNGHLFSSKISSTTHLINT